ncbi:MAG TPA: ERAP1-like C-terminal domain-containing protein, partial [Terracidiphilus sp.]|nr:ERAP1-like C-terminal domain-containing protein [Terracidiphilus sp.]
QLHANKLSTGDYLNLVAGVKSDSNAEVISTAIDGVRIIYNRIAASSGERQALSAWIRVTFSPEYARLGAPSSADSDNKRELRAQLFDVLGLYGKDPAITAEARTLAEQYLADPTSVDPTLRETALTVAARNGDAKLFDQFLHVYETTADPELQNSALRSLAQFRDPSLVQRALEFAVSGKVRNQDAARQIAISLSIPHNRAQTWQFIQTHWNQVQAQFTMDMGQRLVGATDAFCTAPSRDNVQQFFATHPVEAADVYLRHAIEAINGCIELRAQQEPQLKSWLATRPGL